MLRIRFVKDVLFYVSSTTSEYAFMKLIMHSLSYFYMYA
jgi:hypothetical protein